MHELNNPVPTADIIIKYAEGIVLIRRKNPPYGWAIPGGFVDYGESLEAAACREAKEETVFMCVWQASFIRIPLLEGTPAFIQ